MILDLVVSLIRQAVADGTYRMSGHAVKRAKSRNIEIVEIKAVMLSGEAIEWAEEPEGPEILFLGYVRNQLPLYVKCGVTTDKYGNQVVIITAHWQDPKKWKTDRERRL